MVSRKSTARRMMKKEAENLEDDTSFMLQSFQENNIALAKALAKQKAMQKDFKEMEVANNILKAKGKMCARQCKELTEVLDEHLQVVLGQVSTFVDTLMVIASVVKKHKQKNEALLQMIENDEIAEVPVTAMSRTQLVNPMVGGHTLKKASIALQRLDMTNLNMAQNNGMPVEDDEARGDGIDRTRPMNRVTQTLEVDEDMLVTITGDENPAMVQEEPVVIQDIQVSGTGRAGRGRPRSRPPRTAGTNEEPVVFNGNEITVDVQDELPVEVQDEPAVIQENGVSSDEDSDAEVSIVEDNPAQHSQPLRRNSSTQVNDSSFSADTSAILDVSIQTKFPHYPLGRPLRSPSVSLERLSIHPTSRSMPCTQRQLSQTADVGITSASSVQCNRTVRQQISNNDNFSNRASRNSSAHASELASNSSETCQVNRKLSRTVSLVDIRSSVSLNKASSGSQTNEEEIVSFQESNRLMPRVSLVDIGSNVKNSQKPSVDPPEEIACIFEGRNLNPRVHLVDISKPNYGDASDPEVVCFADRRTVESRMNLLANDGTSYDEPNASLSDISVKLATRKMNGSAEMGRNKELKIMLPKVDVITPSPNRRSREPSVSKVSGTSVGQSCPNENNNSVLQHQDSIISLSSSACQLTPQKNNERTNSEIGSSPSGTKLIPRVNLVDIVSSPPKAGSKPSGRKVISSEKVQEVGQVGEKKLVVALRRDDCEQLQKTSVHNGRFRKRRTSTGGPSDSSPVLSRNVVRLSALGRKSEDELQPLRKEEPSSVASPQKVPTPTGRKRVAALNVPAVFSEDRLHSRTQGKKPSSLSRLEAIQTTIQSVAESMSQQRRTVVDISESQPMVNGHAEESTELRPADRVQGSPQQAPVATRSFPVLRMDDDPLEGPSWLYDTQDSRSGYYTRHHGNSDPTFCMGSSDEEGSSFDSPYTPRKKKRKHSDTSKKSSATATENKTKSPDLVQGRRSLRIRQKTSRQTIKDRKIS